MLRTSVAAPLARVVIMSRLVWTTEQKEILTHTPVWVLVLRSSCGKFCVQGEVSHACVVSDVVLLFSGSLIPYCSTLVLYGQTYGPGSTQSYYYYSCQATTAPPVIAFQTTSDERDETTSSATASTTSTTATTTASSSSISVTSSSTSSTVSSLGNTSAMSSPSTTQNPTKADGASSSSIAIPSATATSQTSSNGLSQTSQIGIAVGASIGVFILLASLAFWFFRHRKAKADKKWLDQSPQNFSVYPHHMDSTKAGYPFDYRSDSQRTTFPGKSEGEVQETYELSSTGRLHELPTNH
jgi:hypothetical protein